MRKLRRAQDIKVLKAKHNFYLVKVSAIDLLFGTTIETAEQAICLKA